MYSDSALLQEALLLIWDAPSDQYFQVRKTIIQRLMAFKRGIASVCVATPEGIRARFRRPRGPRPLEASACLEIPDARASTCVGGHMESHLLARPVPFEGVSDRGDKLSITAQMS